LARLVVLLRGGGTTADADRTIAALQQHTSDLNVYTTDPRSADMALPTAAARSDGVFVVRADVESGAVDDGLALQILEWIAEPDVALLEVGVSVAANWEESLRAAVYEDSVIATASAASSDLLSLDAHPKNGSGDVPAADGGTTLGEPLWGCVYIRRDALNIARNSRYFGSGDRSAPRVEDLVGVPGIVHVLAATVVERQASFRRTQPDPPTAPAVRSALARIEVAVEPLRVLVDMRCCIYPLSGTQVHALNLVSQLARRDDVAVSMLMPLYPDKSSQPHLSSIAAAVRRYGEGELIDPAPHVFHRPYQIFEGQISDLVTYADRLVITHQDMILDRTPAYFRSKEKWRTYAAATALSFAAADEIVFYSEHAREEALRDGLLDRSKTSVVPPGTDHFDEDTEGVARPAALESSMASGEPEFLFFVGNNYIHKNRLFAIRVVDELRRHHGWSGALVCAGGRTPAGHSADDEIAFEREHQSEGSIVRDLSRVSGAELCWLYKHASLVLFPSLYEGFGLVPFEAAAAGTASVYPSRSSVAEYLPSEGALLDLTDVPATARRVQRVLADADLANAIVQAIRSTGKALTWSRTAESYVHVYKRSLTRPVGLSAVLGREVTVGARSETASTEAERRMLQLFRRSPAVRRTADALLKVALAGRRATRR
jgi:glycosyltransferase involved in cell wall biosynthesis